MFCPCSLFTELGLLTRSVVTDVKDFGEIAYPIRTISSSAKMNIQGQRHWCVPNETCAHTDIQMKNISEKKGNETGAEISTRSGSALKVRHTK